MRLLAFVATIALVSQNMLAAEPQAQPPAPVDPSLPPKTVISSQQIEHLKSAAEHLVKAGRREDAHKLREQIAIIEAGRAEALLARKEKELDALRAEVEQLRKLTGRHPQIVLAFQVFEISRGKLQNLGIRAVNEVFGNEPGKQAEITGPANRAAVAVHDPAVIKAALEALRSNDLVRVLAEPTLVTVSGRQAIFNSGGEFPVIVPQGDGTAKVEYRQFGTRVEALPVLLGDGKVRIQVRAKVSEIDDDHALTVNGSKVPRLQETMVVTAADLRFGESLLLNGPPRARIAKQKDANGNVDEPDSEREMLVVITPTQVDAPERAVFTHPVQTNFYIPLPTAAKAMDANQRK